MGHIRKKNEGSLKLHLMSSELIREVTIHHQRIFSYVLSEGNHLVRGALKRQRALGCHCGERNSWRTGSVQSPQEEVQVGLSHHSPD